MQIPEKLNKWVQNLRNLSSIFTTYMGVKEQEIEACEKWE
jgi:hypothetical protein